MDDTQALTEMFKALSDPTRLRLVRMLGAQDRGDDTFAGGCGGSRLCVNALAHHLGVSQSAVSQHLRVLRQARLVQGTREGNFVHYSLDHKQLAECGSALGELFDNDLTSE